MRSRDRGIRAEGGAWPSTTALSASGVSIWWLAPSSPLACGSRLARAPLGWGCPRAVVVYVVRDHVHDQRPRARRVRQRSPADDALGSSRTVADRRSAGGGTTHFTSERRRVITPATK